MVGFGMDAALRARGLRKLWMCFTSDFSVEGEDLTFERAQKYLAGDLVQKLCVAEGSLNILSGTLSKTPEVVFLEEAVGVGEGAGVYKVFMVISGKILIEAPEGEVYETREQASLDLVAAMDDRGFTNQVDEEGLKFSWGNTYVMVTVEDEDGKEVEEFYNRGRSSTPADVDLGDVLAVKRYPDESGARSEQDVEVVGEVATSVVGSAALQFINMYATSVRERMMYEGLEIALADIMEDLAKQYESLPWLVTRIDQTAAASGQAGLYDREFKVSYVGDPDTISRVIIQDCIQLLETEMQIVNWPQLRRLGYNRSVMERIVGVLKGELATTVDSQNNTYDGISFQRDLARLILNKAMIVYIVATPSMNLPIWHSSVEPERTAKTDRDQGKGLQA